VTRLRPLTEAECYARCYGLRDDTVTILHPAPRAARPLAVRVSGEQLRRGFEQKLDTRDPAELIEPEAA
jgi:hypothetical protein